MKVHLKSGKILETKGDMPTVFNGLVRFNKNVDLKDYPKGALAPLVSPVAEDPVIPLENIEYMEPSTSPQN